MADVTAAIDHYDGIFKFVYSQSGTKSFLEARDKLSKGDWQSSVTLFQKTRDLVRDYPEDVETVNLVLRELERSKMSSTLDGITPADVIDWSGVRRRTLCRLDEENSALPQGIFFLNIKNENSGDVLRLVGRKLVSKKWIANQIPELFCSNVHADMILGMFVDLRITETKYIIWYRPVNPKEKLAIFRDIINRQGFGVELVFPFPLLKKDTKREFGSPPEGWEIDDAFDVMLSYGEEDIRQFTVEYLATLPLNNPIFYDPACSTGVFLAAMKSSFPDSYTIGQDLSKQMTEVSRERVDEVHCGNALNPKVGPGSADVVFVRFLTSEVVQSTEAEELLDAVLPTVRRGGHLILIGHTPVLLSSSHLDGLTDFTLLRSVGMTKDKTAIFQYYILQRK